VGAGSTFILRLPNDFHLRREEAPATA
jgi:hypothetical protein